MPETLTLTDKMKQLNYYVKAWRDSCKGAKTFESLLGTTESYTQIKALVGDVDVTQNLFKYGPVVASASLFIDVESSTEDTDPKKMLLREMAIQYGFSEKPAVEGSGGGERVNDRSKKYVVRTLKARNRVNSSLTRKSNR